MKEILTAWIRLWACLGSHTEKCMLPACAEHGKPLHSSCKLLCRIKAARYYATATELREIKLYTRNWEFKFSAKKNRSFSFQNGRTALLIGKASWILCSCACCFHCSAKFVNYSTFCGTTRIYLVGHILFKKLSSYSNYDLAEITNFTR